MKHSDFVHLHLHTQFSLLDGAIPIRGLLKRVEEYQMPAVAVTDHGNMFGAVEFYTSAVEYGIKPIVGCEVYVAPKSRLDRGSPSGNGTEKPFHLILLVKNQKGYKNLCQLITQSFLEGFYYKPRIDLELLAARSEGLIGLTSCLNGQVPRMFLNGEDKKAEEAAGRYLDILGRGNFYLELQDHGLPEQKTVNHKLIALGRDLSVPLVATNDCHYMNQADSRAHDVLLCIGTGKTLKDEKRMRYKTNQFYVKSPAEMKAVFHEVPEAVSNTILIAEQCNLEMEFDTLKLPHYDVPGGTPIHEYLTDLALRGLETRFRQMEEQGEKVTEDRRKLYLDRLEMELRVIKNSQFSGYFLIVWDFIDYARKKEIPVGPGRGSAAGSLVAYSLRITDIDPIRYNLLFERFLNEGRVSMPDIDIDFCMDGRDEVIRYVTEKYGRENVSQIITFGTLMAKGVIRDVGRVMDMAYGEVDRIAKLVPDRLKITLDQAVEEEPKLKEMKERDDRIRDLLEVARSLEGLTRHASTHAAGVVISPTPLTNFMPLYKTNKGEITSQYQMTDIERLGLLKMDFLGLRTLTVIHKTERMVKALHDPKFQVDRIPLDDADTYRLLSEAKTFGVFQLESRGIRDILRKMRPATFEDLVALVALYRPGPLQSGMVDDFIKRKHHPHEIKNAVPELDPVLQETYGVILYQEQVMRIAHDLAGFTLQQADLLRKAMGKKKPEVMAEQRELFMEGTRKKKIPEGKAKSIFDLMEKFGGYGFNKSHSAAYALVAYQTAYLKSHYAVEYMASLLSSEMENTDKVIQYINECKEMGIRVLPPDVNESDPDFTVVGGNLRFGLAAVKNVGVTAVESIRSARSSLGRFQSLTHFCENVDLRVVNKRVVESLVKCGAFDSTGEKRKRMMDDLESVLEASQKIQRDREMGQVDLFGEAAMMEAVRPAHPGGNGSGAEWSERERFAFEKEALGFYISGHPLSSYEKLLRRWTNMDSAGVKEAAHREQVKIYGMISKTKTQLTKKGDRMAYLTLEDLTGSVEVVVWPDKYKEFQQVFEAEEPVLVDGVTDVMDDNVKVIAERILPVADYKNWGAKRVHVTLNTTGLDLDLLREIRDLLDRYRGNCAVFIHLQFPNQEEVCVSTDERLRVSPDGELLDRLEGMVGADSVYLD